MATIYQEKLSKEEILKRVGDISQIADAREGVLTSGRADGVRVIDVKTGSGLEFSVLPSRGMDIAWASYQGKAISFLSKTGVVKPEMFEKDGLSFLRSFTCGLLTTCGLTYMGAPCIDRGEELGLHGRISHIPAREVSVDQRWAGDEFLMEISGKVIQSAMFGERMVLERRIHTELGARKLQIYDVIRNEGFSEQPLMLLYHINFGYPVISESTRLIQSEKTLVTGRDEDARGGLDRYDQFDPPLPGYREQVFFHDLSKCRKKAGYSCLFNDRLKYGAYVKYNLEEFSHLGQWKMMGEGDYVVGIEPGNWLPLGRAEARARKELTFLKPFETREFHYEIGVVESEGEIADILQGEE